MSPAVPGSPSEATVAELLRAGAATLADAQVERPAREARLLLAHALGLSLSDLLRDRNSVVDAGRFAGLLARRAAREPMALIVGRQGFWTLDLAVSADTLVPRADSEALVEAALLHRPDRMSVRRVLDLGTGTGCLLLAALSEFPHAWGLGVELSPLGLRAWPATTLGPAAWRGAPLILCASWGDAIPGRGAARAGARGFDLVLSNPPYIAGGDIDQADAGGGAARAAPGARRRRGRAGLLPAHRGGAARASGAGGRGGARARRGAGRARCAPLPPRPGCRISGRATTSAACRAPWCSAPGRRRDQPGGWCGKKRLAAHAGAVTVQRMQRDRGLSP